MLNEAKQAKLKELERINKLYDLFDKTKENLVGEKLTKEGFDLIASLQNDISESSHRIDAITRDINILETSIKLNK